MQDDWSDKELEIVHDLRIPAPLDPHISSVSIRTGSNNPADYFDLLLSASFGAEYVTIESGEDIIEFKLSIQKAELKLNGVNCSFSLFGTGSPQSDAWTGQETKSDARASAKGASLNAELKADGGAGLAAASSVGIDYSHNKTDQRNRTLTRDVLPYRILNDDTIQIGYGDDFLDTVQGRVIDENIGVRVTPSALDAPIGVLIRARVRERWIKIENARKLNRGSKLDLFWKFLETESKEAERKRHLFSKLVAHLLAMQLQEVGDETNATLSAAAVVFASRSARIRGVNAQNRSGRIRVDPTAIDRFLKADEHHDIQILREMGVDLPEELGSAINRDVFLGFWRDSFSLGQFYMLDTDDIGKLLEAISMSFGLNLRVFKKRASGVIITFQFTKGSQGASSADAIFDNARDVWNAEGTLIACGALLKGELAFKFAQAFGFNKSYQTLQKRMRRYVRSSGYGNLISYADILTAINREDVIEDLVGLKLTLPSFTVLRNPDTYEV